MKVLMFSGGLDSACAWHILDKPRCLYCGGYDGPAREANAGELHALQALLALDPDFAQCLTAKAFDWSPFMRAGHYTLPRENILAICAWAEGYTTVLYAWNKNDNPDPERIAHMKRVTQAAVDMDGFTSDFPVWKYYKHQLVREALLKGAHPVWLQASWSCVTRGDIHCGECTNCCERWLAFAANDIQEPAGTYRVHPQNTPRMNDMREEFKANRHFIGVL